MWTKVLAAFQLAALLAAFPSAAGQSYQGVASFYGGTSANFAVHAVCMRNGS
jgi:hypothetical protein